MKKLLFIISMFLLVVSCTKETTEPEGFQLLNSVSSITTNDTATGIAYKAKLVTNFNSNELKFISISDKEGAIVIENYTINSTFLAKDTLDLYYTVFEAKEFVDGLFLNYNLNGQYKSKAIYGPFTVFQLY